MDLEIRTSEIIVEKFEKNHYICIGKYELILKLIRVII